MMDTLVMTALCSAATTIAPLTDTATMEPAIVLLALVVMIARRVLAPMIATGTVGALTTIACALVVGRVGTVRCAVVQRIVQDTALVSTALVTVHLDTVVQIALLDLVPMIVPVMDNAQILRHSHVLAKLAGLGMIADCEFVPLIAPTMEPA